MRYLVARIVLEIARMGVDDGLVMLKTDATGQGSMIPSAHNVGLGDRLWTAVAVSNDRRETVGRRGSTARIRTPSTVGKSRMQ